MRYIATGLFLLLAASASAQPITAPLVHVEFPNRVDVVERVAAANPARFACAHTDRGCAYDFIQALVCELRKNDARWGMNGRRGDPARPSWERRPASAVPKGSVLSG